MFTHGEGLDPVRKRGRVGRAEGRIWPPNFASSFSSSSSPLGAGLAQWERCNPRSGAPGTGQGEGKRAQCGPDPVFSFLASVLMRGRNAGLEPGRILSKPSCKKTWKEREKLVSEHQLPLGVGDAFPAELQTAPRALATSWFTASLGWGLPELLLTPIHGMAWNIWRAGLAGVLHCADTAPCQLCTPSLESQHSGAQTPKTSYT